MDTIQLNRHKISDLVNTHNLVNRYLQNSLPESINSSINCRYYSENHLNQISERIPPKFSIFHMNIRSLCKHRLELQLLLNVIDHQFDIIALSEIGKSNVANCATFFSDYELFYHPTSTKCGGTAILVKKDLKVIAERNDLNLPETHTNDCNYNVENNWVEIKSKHLKSSIIIGCIYRHPKGKINVFSEELDRKLQLVDKEKKMCFLVGDFNINALSIDHEPSETFINSLLSQNYIPHITLPTRITDTSATLIDQIFVKYNSNVMSEGIISGNLISDISDHLPNILLFGKQSDSNNNKSDRPLIRLFSEKNIMKFKEFLSEIDWNQHFSEKDASENFDVLSDNINKGFDTCFPLKRLSKRRSKDKPWVTKGIKISSNNKSKLHRKIMDSHNDHLKCRYKTYKTMLFKVCREAEAKYFASLLTDTKASVKKLWDTLGPMIKPEKARKSHNRIEKLVVDGKVVSENKSMANTFNEYFVNIGKNLADKIPTSSKCYKDYLGTALDKSMYLFPTSVEEVTKIMLNLNVRKTSGPNCIPTKIVKACHQQLADPLTKIFNKSFDTGIFPANMKNALVIPLHKKNEKYIPGNYRPISLLNVFGKIFEKIMHKRLYSFLTKFKILYQLQFGFRTNHSTSLALLDIMERIHESLDKDSMVLGLYIDLQKAFDTVNHEILLDKLNHYGIRGIVNTWFKSYLSNRQQCVTVNGVKSNSLPINIGVPQGSVLGPLLFLIYVNDIAKSVSNSSIVTMLFADDTNIFIESKDPITLMTKAKTTLQDLQDWFCCNKLSLSIDKTHYSIFRTINKNIPLECDSIPFNDTHIMRVPHTKYLGVILDDKLNWKSHIQSILPSLVKTASAFKFISHIIPHKFKTNLYYAYVYSKLAYGIEVYGHAAKTSLRPLQIQQNRILKILFHRDWFTDTDVLHTNLNILKIKDIFKLQLVQFIYRQQRNQLPKVFDKYFTKNSELHRYGTRQLKKLHVCKTKKKKIGEKTVRYYGALQFNLLPENVLCCKTSKSFRKKTKQHFISLYKTQ